MPPGFQLIGVTNIGEVKPGDDLVGYIVEAAKKQGTPILNGDVVVVTQKIVSKAEGRLVDLSSIEPSEFARRVASGYEKDPRHMELILREAKRIIRMDQGIVITETKHGFVCANAGIDASNVEGEGMVALLPEDSDRSAEGIRKGIKAKAGADVAVVISDTFGRPWREGCTNVAIGVAGMKAVIDYRGQSDPKGFVFKASVLAVADELASTAELVMGKISRIPVAIVRGYEYPRGAGGASELVRDPSKDMFR